MHILGVVKSLHTLSALFLRHLSTMIQEFDHVRSSDLLRNSLLSGFDRWTSQPGLHRLRGVPRLVGRTSSATRDRSERGLSRRHSDREYSEGELDCA